MKIKILIAALLGLTTATAFAQKGELKDAQENYTKFDGLRSTPNLAKQYLASAKTSIDKASVNEKTSTLPLTIAMKAEIYASLAVLDDVPANAATDFSTAADAVKKAKELDTKNENSKLINHANLEMAQYLLNKGVTEFQGKKFNDAYMSFDAARQIIPDDTTAILNTAITAINTQKYAAGIANYNKLLTTNYSQKQNLYNDLPALYLANKDTAGALRSINEGVAKYPTNTDLRNKEIVISLQTGQQNNLVAKVESAIKNDPGNKNLYYYAGLTYSQIAETAGKEVKKLQKAAAKSAPAKPDPQIAKLEQVKDDNFGRATEAYKKAIAIDPNYFEANLNLGYVIISPAIDSYNRAQQLPVSQVKAYNDAMAKVNTQFDLAKPYLLKAVELNPNSVDALTNLKSYYLGKKDTENANAVQKKIDALPVQK